MLGAKRGGEGLNGAIVDNVIHYHAFGLEESGIEGGVGPAPVSPPRGCPARNETPFSAEAGVWRGLRL